MLRCTSTRLRCTREGKIKSLPVYTQVQGGGAHPSTRLGCIMLPARRIAKRAKVAPGKRPCRPESARRLPPPPFPPASLFPAPVPFSLTHAPPPRPIPRRPRHPSAPALAPIPLRLTRPIFLRLQTICFPPSRAPPIRALARPRARSPFILPLSFLRMPCSVTCSSFVARRDEGILLSRPA